MWKVVKLSLLTLFFGVCGYRLYKVNAHIIPEKVLLYPAQMNAIWRAALGEAKGSSSHVDLPIWEKQAAELMTEEQLRKGIDTLLARTSTYLPTESSKKILQRYKTGALLRGLSEQKKKVIKRFVWKMVYDALMMHKIIQKLPLRDKSEFSGLGDPFVFFMERSAGRVGPHGLWVNQQNDPAASVYGGMKYGEVIARKENEKLMGKKALLWVTKRLALFVERNRANLPEALRQSPAWANHVIVQKLECEYMDKAGSVVRQILKLQKQESNALSYIWEHERVLYTAALKGGFCFGGLGAYYCGAANDASSMGSILLEMKTRGRGSCSLANLPLDSHTSDTSAFDLLIEKGVKVSYPIYPEKGDIIVSKTGVFVVLDVDEERGELTLGGCCFTDPTKGYLESVGGVAAFRVDWSIFGSSREFYVQNTMGS